MNSISPIIRLDDNDNVIIARIPISAGTVIKSESLSVLNDIDQGHKIASRFLSAGTPILKYNTVIGYASEDIHSGTWVHSHNIRFDEVSKDYAFSKHYIPTNYIPESERATFQGIVREDGRVATRNYLGVFVVGNCGATTARMISNYFDDERLESYSNVDGVIPYVHEMGCGMEMTGEPMDLLRRTLAGYIRHPNTAGALIIALGCERNNLAGFLEQESLTTGKMLKTLVMQELGGTANTIQLGKQIIKKMLPIANKIHRETVSAEHIIVGLQCGGSDGLSGLSANPALGKAVDILVRNGGTAILSETSEIFGVEHTLTTRAVTPEVGQKLIDRINWWLEYNKGKDTQINGRVSPGNHAGGLANVLEKSLGGAKKGGNSPLMEVYKYAESVTQKGLVFMDTPGYDPVSATGQLAGGANLICFTTGRGSCFGSFPAPTIKLASNTPMYLRMVNDMDINCGAVIDGDKSLEQMGQEIFQAMLDVASGLQSKSEEIGVGENEFAPWPIGVLA
ncbi:UxaA family hydrolase [Kangiella sp.]|uniref:UxaA family hydrolase n=1 Tax=Kangiella sp. TaxID=1920245 RepID=UPI003A92D757